MLPELDWGPALVLDIGHVTRNSPVQTASGIATILSTHTWHHLSLVWTRIFSLVISRSYRTLIFFPDLNGRHLVNDLNQLQITSLAFHSLSVAIPAWFDLCPWQITTLLKTCQHEREDYWLHFRWCSLLLLTMSWRDVVTSSTFRLAILCPTELVARHQ